MTVHLLKNKTDDTDKGRIDLYQQYIPNASFIPILNYVPVDFDSLLATLEDQSFEAIIITSQRSVDVLKDALAVVENSQAILQLPVYTVGPATTDRLRLVGFNNVIGAESGNGVALASKMVEDLGKERKKFIFFAGKVHRPQLPQRLISAGHDVITHIVYETEPVDFVPNLKSSMKSGDWVVFFSPSFTTEIFPLLTPDIRVAAIGPTTRDHLEQNNIKVDAMAASPTAESLAEAIKM